MKRETAESRQDSSRPEWDPEWTQYRFTAWGQCSNSACIERFSILGEGGVDHNWDPDDGECFDDFFEPLICQPMPDMIVFPRACPKPVKAALQDAFTLFWSNRAACAGRIRVALELLMDGAGVKEKGENGKPLWLDDRLKEFAKTEPAIAANLTGIKLLGNAGSHEMQLDAEDLLDAFEILEHSLSELFAKPGVRAATLAQDLAVKYAPES